MVVNATNMAACVRACCYSGNCHVALLHKQHCVNLECKNAEVCQLTAGNGSSVVVVRAVDSRNILEGDTMRKEKNR